jgi:hypothetical protein
MEIPFYASSRLPSKERWSFWAFHGTIIFGGLAKGFYSVMPDLIPEEHGIFDRHPSKIECRPGGTGFRLPPE